MFVATCSGVNTKTLTFTMQLRLKGPPPLPRRKASKPKTKGGARPLFFLLFIAKMIVMCLVSVFSLVWRESRKARVGGLSSGVAEGNPFGTQMKVRYPSVDNQNSIYYFNSLILTKLICTACENQVL